MAFSCKIHMNKPIKIRIGAAALITAGVAVGAAITPPQATITVTEGDLSPRGNGYSLIGDICEPIPEGYVETRSKCEMGVDRHCSFLWIMT